ncbi:hypothetical protein BDZ89DRAFT_392717 [Hymenopellis radicata]|nr:hypothetical protein BDZ89DRAFT_392717 [Hymenopellis radicata]
MFEWMDYHTNSVDAWRVRLEAHKLASEIYTKLGNTGAAVEQHWALMVTQQIIPEVFASQATRGFPSLSEYPVDKILSQRHPDPALTHKHAVTTPSLQILGSWKKLNTQGLSPRMFCSNFVHDGYLYTFGGQKAAIGPFFTELWRLNLTTLGAWEQLPSYPHTGQSFPVYSNHRMAFNAKDNKAYLFLGSLSMPYFNVAENKWGRIKTTFQGTWPWGQDTKNNVLHCIDGMLYVFGGTHDPSPVGTDLLMVLDIEKREWRLLTGEGKAKHPDFFSPGPREHACSWVGKGGKKIYVMYGDADRMAAKLAKKEHASGTTYEYDDLWCYDLTQNKWTKMRILGNAPCRRTEMSCVYNPVLDKVITFGGYTPRVPTMSLETQEFFQFSYYADTFMLDSDDPVVSSWKHVLTRGFPIYRAQAHLFVDEKTGKTYMFSGYTNSQFVPGQKQLVSRSFADVWELRLDMEGGFFDTVDIEEEAKIARVGPFQRCFACGSAGLWKKCGTCKGKVYFCNQQCLRDEWRTHKELHKCRKV